jgi:7-cyano-7-deazaguanine reductase
MKNNNKKSVEWSDKNILKSLPNPSLSGYEIKIKCPEITFEGVRGQPDFAELYVTFFPDKKIVELKSMKEYFYQFRGKILSYERLINVIYEDMIEVYSPARLRLVMICNARGGISSKLTIDSDWHIRGGKESFRDWVGQDDMW